MIGNFLQNQEKLRKALNSYDVVCAFEFDIRDLTSEIFKLNLGASPSVVIGGFIEYIMRVANHLCTYY